jgi:DNA-binding LacI/PurR family transcriptional regulator
MHRTLAALCREGVTGNVASVTTPEERSGGAARVRDYRARLRAQGLRPVQIWVPDVRSPEFTEEAHRQSAAVAGSDCAGDDQAFIDALTAEDA